MSSDVLADDRQVVERTKARLKVPGAVEPVEHSTIDELLLSDGEVVYQCVHPDPIPGATEPCEYVNESAVGVRAHQKAHGKVALARYALNEATKAQLAATAAEAELAERRRRRVEGSRKGAETRKKNQNGDQGEAKQTVLVAEIQRELSKLSVDIERIGSDLAGVVDGLNSVKQLVSHLPSVDPEVVEKAQRFDAIQASLTGLRS